MSYSKSHVILIAFALDTLDSLDNVTSKARTIAFGFLVLVLIAITVD